jgi:hypothetical protein
LLQSFSESGIASITVYILRDARKHPDTPDSFAVLRAGHERQTHRSAAK